MITTGHSYTMLAVLCWLCAPQVGCSSSTDNSAPISEHEVSTEDNEDVCKDIADELEGTGADVLEGVVAVIDCAEGTNVVPQTILHFSGAGSYSSFGAIEKWKWTVEQPTGSRSLFVPSDAVPEPSFEANVTGTYTFHLSVFDDTGRESPVLATMVVVVKPEVALHIELLWDTPGDPDQTDTGTQAGSDVDLHLAHPWAEGHDVDGDGVLDGYFDNPYDCYWFTGHPNWGSYDSKLDDPGLDRADKDGAGPENLNLAEPEPVVYRVGVHYWKDYSFGESYVNLRIYLHGELAFEEAGVLLANDDLWDACTIEFPEGLVEPVTNDAGAHKVIPNYSEAL